MLKTTHRASVAATSLFAAGTALADVTVYTAGPAGLIEQLAAGFTAETSIVIEFYQATTGNIMARIEAEAANPVVDVLISASWDTATDFAERGWLAPTPARTRQQCPISCRLTPQWRRASPRWRSRGTRPRARRGRPNGPI